VSIANFEYRLCAFASIGVNDFLAIATKSFESYCENPEETAKLVVRNFLRRREYVERYFRLMFKSEADTKDVCNDAEYLAFGKSFLDMHNKKK